MQPFFTEALANHPPNTTSVVAYAELPGPDEHRPAPHLGGGAPPDAALTAGGCPRRRRYVTVQLLRAPVVFGLSIQIAIVFGPSLGMAAWGSIVIVAIAIHRAFADVAAAGTLQPAAPSTTPREMIAAEDASV